MKTLSFDGFCANMTTEDMQSLMNRMQRLEYVKRSHHYNITQGKDGRYFTNVYRTDVAGSKYKSKIAARTMEELMDKLYDFYKSKETVLTLKSLYGPWIQEVEETATRSTTPNVYRITWRRYFEDQISAELISKPIQELRAQDVEAWGKRLIKAHGLTRKQFSMALTVIHSILDMQVGRTITRNVSRDVIFRRSLFKAAKKATAETSVFTTEEIAAIERECLKRASKKGDAKWMAIPLQLYTACRPGEVLALEWEDIDLKTGRIFFHKMLAADVMPDGSQVWSVHECLKQNAQMRTVHLSPSAIRVLEDIQALSGKTTGRLFDARATDCVRYRLRVVCQTLGITQRSPHCLRKTAISRMIDGGIAFDYVREMVGHCDIATTQRSYEFNSRGRKATEAAVDAVL